MRFHPFPSSDCDLVRGTLADRDGAFEKLVLRYQKKALAVARANGVERSAVDDVVQEAFLRALRSLPELREPARFGAWFLSIVRNVSRTEVAGRRSRAATPLEAEPAAEPSRPPLEVDELRERLWRRVDELSPGVREAIYLYYQDGRRTKDIARALGISTSAVRVRLHEGRKLLRERLWRELGAALRDMLPSTRDLRKRGRALTLLALSAVSTDWLLRAKVGAALTTAAAGAATLGPAAGGTHSTLGTGVIGGSIVTGKKIVISGLISLAALAAGVSFFSNGSGTHDDESATTTAAPPGATRRSQPPTEDSTPAGPRPEETAAAAPVVDAARETDRAPLLGVVRDPDGKPVAGAAVVALHLGPWLEIADAFRDAENRTASSRLAERYRDFSERHDTITDEDGAFRFVALPPDEYRILVVHPAHLVHCERSIEVTGVTPIRLEIQLAGAFPITGRVEGPDGRPLGNADILVERVESESLGAAESLVRLVERHELGRDLFEQPFVTDADGAFVVPSLEPARYRLDAGSPDHPLRSEVAVDAGCHVVVRLEPGVSVSGRVVAPGRRPVAHAVVRVRPARSMVIERLKQPTRRDLSRPSWEATTRADGRFTIEALPGTPLELTVSSAEHPLLEQRLPAAAEAVDLGDIELEAALQIAGRVVDADGAPIPGVKVWIPEEASGYFLEDVRAPFVETTTDVDGRFVLAPLEDGSYRVHTSSAKWVDTHRRGIPTGTMDLEVHLERGGRIRGRIVDGMTHAAVGGARVTFGRVEGTSDERGHFDLEGIPYHHRGSRNLEARHRDFGTAVVDVTLPLGDDAPLTVVLERAHDLAGVVVGPGGEPVHRATVRLASRHAFGAEIRAGSIDWTTTDRDGAFRLEANPAGLSGAQRRAFIIVRHPDFAPRYEGPLRIPASGERWPEFTIPLERGGAVLGVVRDGRGGVVSGARVLLGDVIPGRVDGEWSLSLLSRETWTDSEGRYRLERVAVGPVSVRVVAAGFAPAVRRIPAGAGELQLDFNLTSGAEIEGTIVDAGGAPLGGAEIAAFLEPPEEAENESLVVHDLGRGAERRAVAGSRDDGRFTLAHLAPGNYTLVVRADGYSTTTIRDVDSSKGRFGDIVLRRHGAVEGTVRDHVTRRAVQSFRIEIVDVEEDRRLEEAGVSSGPTFLGSAHRGSVGAIDFSSLDGRFLFDGLREGRYRVVCRSPEYLEWSGDISIAAGEVEAVEIRLERGAALRGVVKSLDDGRPIPGAHVLCYLGSPFPREYGTNAAGEFASSGLPPGEAEIRALHAHFRTPGGARKVRLEAGTTTEVEIGMKPAGGYRIQLRNLVSTTEKDGTPVHYFNWARVERVERGPGGEETRRQVLMTIIQPDGEFEISSLEPGSYTLHVERRPHDSEQSELVRRIDVDIVAGEIGSREIELPAAE